ncbi:MAG: hypothetical protein QOF98_3675 [Streptomyces sp.]|nr:hypothetical protein [Streptomyces sp.]
MPWGTSYGELTVPTDLPFITHAPVSPGSVPHGESAPSERNSTMAYTPATSQAEPAGTADTPDHRPTPTGRKLTVLLLALLWPAQMFGVANVFAANAQAQVAEHFHTTEIAWFTLIYALFGTLMTPFAVKAGDRFGKRRVIIGIVALGLIGDVITAMAPNFSVMLTGRAVAACYAPIGALVFATVRDVFPARRVAVATGIIGAGAGAITTVVPVLAGWLLDDYGFRSALWVLSGCTAFALLLVIAFVPETEKRLDDGGFDWIGILLLGGSITALIYGIGQGTVWGWTSPKTLGLLVGAIAAAGVFALVERRVKHPLMDIGFFGRREVATVLTATSLVQGISYAYSGTLLAVLTLYPFIPGVSGGLGWSVMHSALIGLPAGILLFGVGVGVGVGAAARRLNPLGPWLLGVVLLIVGIVLQGLYHADETQFIATGLVAALGIGMIYAGAPVLVLRAVSREEQALASGMSVMLVGLMVTVGTQVIFTVLNHDSSVLHGVALYHGNGYRNAFFALAGCIGVGLVISLLIPKLRTVDTEE